MESLTRLNLFARHPLQKNSGINHILDRFERSGSPMKTILSVVIVAGLMAADLSYAQSGADVVKTKGCLACHAADQKKVGPSYKDLAAKYSGDKAAEDKLVAKLKEGKAHPKIMASDSELKAAVAYILSVK